MQAESRKYHKKFRKYGQKSLHILDKEINNPRYPGFSQFISSNVLRNSAYCWSLLIKNIMIIYIIYQN